MRTIYLFFILVPLLISCNEPEKPITEKAQVISALNSNWFHHCKADEDVPTLYHRREERFTQDNNFELVFTIYTDSPTCTGNALARVEYSGTFSLHNPFNTSIASNPGQLVQAWEIDLVIDQMETSGNKLLAITKLNMYSVGTLFDIVYIDRNKRYNGILSNSFDQRPSMLQVESDKVSVSIAAPVTEAPVYDTPIAATDIVGMWENGCADESVDTFGRFIKSQINILSESLLEIKYSEWFDEQCATLFSRRLVLAGSFSIIGTLQTANSDVPASIIEIILDPGANIVSIQSIADILGLYAQDAGKILYMLVYHDPQLNILYYGGWRIDDIANLPEELERGITKQNPIIDF